MKVVKIIVDSVDVQFTNGQVETCKQYELIKIPDILAEMLVMEGRARYSTKGRWKSAQRTKSRREANMRFMSRSPIGAKSVQYSDGTVYFTYRSGYRKKIA